jgi:hypothetical protein
MRKSQIYTNCSRRPVAVLEKYEEDQTDKLNQLTFSHLITNIVATQASGNNMNLVPAAYLNVELRADYVRLMKPMQKTVMMGCIPKDAAGKGAYQLIAKHRITMIDGNVGSYSRFLNARGRMEMIRDVNALAAAVAVISKEKVDEKTRAKDNADKKALKKADK